MDKKVILNLSVSQENKEFAIDQYQSSDGRFSSVSHWANEILTSLRKKSEGKCVKKLKD